MQTIIRLIAVIILTAFLYHLNVDSYWSGFISVAEYEVMKWMIFFVSLAGIMSVAEDWLI